MAASSQTIYPRPTLPSLHTLGLPNPIKDIIPMSLDDDDTKHTTTDERTRWHRARQVSVSSTTSSCTDSSGRSTPPCHSDRHESSRSSVSPPPTRNQSNSFSLVRSTMEEANAFVLVPPQQRQYVENISAYSRSHTSSDKSRRNQALLLVGPALDHLRHPRVRIAKGARLHPYRIAPHPSRRQSTVPSTIPHPETSE